MVWSRKGVTSGMADRSTLTNRIFDPYYGIIAHRLKCRVSIFRGFGSLITRVVARARGESPRQVLLWAFAWIVAATLPFAPEDDPLT